MKNIYKNNDSNSLSSNFQDWIKIIIMGSIGSLVTQMVDPFLREREKMTYVFGGIVSTVTGGLDHVTKSEEMKDMLILMKMYPVQIEELGEEGVQMNLSVKSN